MKRVLLYLSLIVANLTPTLSWATPPEADYLIVHLKSGVKIGFSISEAPKIHFEDNVVTIATERLLVSNVSKYTFGTEEDTQLKTVKTPSHLAEVRDDIIIVHNAAGRRIRVFDLGGVEQPVSAQSDVNGTMTVRITSLLPGIYLLAVGSETIQFQKR